MKKILSKILCAVIATGMVLTPLTSLAAAEQPGALEFGSAKEYGEKAGTLITGTYGVPSLSYTIMDGGKVRFSDRFGTYSKTQNRALSKNDIYNIGSVSKMYTAAAAMKLIEDGKLELDGAVVKYLPEFKMEDGRYKDITIRMLLNHSSGLYGSEYGDAFSMGEYDPSAHDEFLGKLAGQELKATPGAFSVYCNDGFILMEQVIEKVSGMTYSRFIEENFTKPLGLKNTRTAATISGEDSRPETYFPNFKEGIRDTVDIIGTGGVYASSEDLAAFGNMLIGNNPNVISEKSAAKMAAEEYKRGMWLPEGMDNTVGYGLGWDSVDSYPFGQYGIKALVKGGDSLLSHASLVALPEQDLVVAVVSSGGSSVINQMYATGILLQTLKEKGLISEIKKDKTFATPAAVDMPKDMEKYSGLYGTKGVTAAVEVKDNRMKVALSYMEGMPDQIFKYTGEGLFKSDDGISTISFTEKGAETYLTIQTYSNIPGVGQTASAYYDVRKISKNILDEKTKRAWEGRNGKKFYCISEGPQSQMLAVAPFTPMFVDIAGGYALGCKITGENTAVNIAQVPVATGRDCYDLEILQEGGMELMKSSDTVSVNEDSIKSMWVDGKSHATISKEGYARWYKIPQTAAGKKMNVDLPKGGAFAVYDDKGLCKFHSQVTGKAEVVIPQGGMAVFLGDGGMRFDINVK